MRKTSIQQKLDRLLDVATARESPLHNAYVVSTLPKRTIPSSLLAAYCYPISSVSDLRRVSFHAYSLLSPIKTLPVMKQTAVRSILLLPLLCPIATTHATALTFLSKAVLSVALILQSGSATKVLGNNPADSLETQNEYLYMALAQPSCTSQPPFNPQDATSPSYNLTPNQPQFIRLYNETKHLKWMFTVNANLYDIEASKSWYMTTKYDDGKQVCDACGTLSTDKINGSQANPSIKWMQAMKGYRIKKIKIDPTRDWIAILFAKTGKKPMTIALCSNGELQFRQYGNHLHALPTMKRLQTADSFYYFDPYDV